MGEALSVQQRWDLVAFSGRSRTRTAAARRGSGPLPGALRRAVTAPTGRATAARHGAAARRRPTCGVPESHRPDRRAAHGLVTGRARAPRCRGSARSSTRASAGRSSPGCARCRSGGLGAPADARGRRRRRAAPGGRCARPRGGRGVAPRCSTRPSRRDAAATPTPAPSRPTPTCASSRSRSASAPSTRRGRTRVEEGFVRVRSALREPGTAVSPALEAEVAELHRAPRRRGRRARRRAAATGRASASRPASSCAKASRSCSSSARCSRTCAGAASWRSSDRSGLGAGLGVARQPRHGVRPLHRLHAQPRRQRGARGRRDAARRGRALLGELLAHLEGRGRALAALHPGQGEARAWPAGSAARSPPPRSSRSTARASRRCSSTRPSSAARRRAT